MYRITEQSYKNGIRQSKSVGTSVIEEDKQADFVFNEMKESYKAKFNSKVDDIGNNSFIAFQKSKESFNYCVVVMEKI